MNLKTELKNLGYYLITPVPQKYHFEGVNNRRSAIQLTVLSALVPVAIYAGALIKTEIDAHRSVRAIMARVAAREEELNKK